MYDVRCEIHSSSLFRSSSSIGCLVFIRSVCSNSPTFLGLGCKLFERKFVVDIYVNNVGVTEVCAVAVDVDDTEDCVDVTEVRTCITEGDTCPFGVVNTY